LAELRAKPVLNFTGGRFSGLPELGDCGFQQYAPRKRVAPLKLAV